jgi:hypothetical protein
MNVGRRRATLLAEFVPTRPFSIHVDNYGSRRRRAAWGVPSRESKVFLVGVICSVLGAPVHGSAPLAHPQSSNVTWSEVVRPILERRCASCHGPGRTASPTLSTYREAARAARLIKRSVLERTMPPWNVAPGFGVFSNDRTLPAHERDLLVSWADGGMKEGPAHVDPVAHAGHAPYGSPHATLVLDAGRASVIDSTRKRYRLATSHAKDRWIAGWHFRPGNQALVRRARVSLESGAPLGVWLPDEDPVFFPPPGAQRLPAGSALILDVEYVEPSVPAQDRSAVALYFAPEAGTPLQHLILRRGTRTLAEAIRVVAMTPALETASQSVRVVATRPDQSVEPLIWIREYDPRFARTYRLQQPVDLPSGTRLDVWSFDADCSVEMTYAGDGGRGITVRKARLPPPP